MIIVTGGAGFIGSNLVEALFKRKSSPITVVDNLGEGDKWKNLLNLGISNIISPKDLMPFLECHAKEVECIFHLGAVSTTTEKNVDYIIENNFTLTLNLWHWCTHHQKRIIYASSAATYGNGDKGFDDSEASDYLTSLRPLNPYGWSKAITDIEVTRLKKMVIHPPQWAGLKFFNVYGHKETHKGAQRSVAHQMFELIEKTGRVKLYKSANPDYKDGEQMRDFVWVGDCVNQMLWLYDNEGISGLFNSGSGKARSFLDLAKACFKTMNRDVDIQWLDTPPDIARHYQYFTQAEMNKIKSFGYDKPMTSLEAGIELYYEALQATKAQN